MGFRNTMTTAVWERPWLAAALPAERRARAAALRARLPFPAPPDVAPRAPSILFYRIYISRCDGFDVMINNTALDRPWLSLFIFPRAQSARFRNDSRISYLETVEHGTTPTARRPHRITAAPEKRRHRLSHGVHSHRIEVYLLWHLARVALAREARLSGVDCLLEAALANRDAEGAIHAKGWAP